MKLISDFVNCEWPSCCRSRLRGETQLLVVIIDVHVGKIDLDVGKIGVDVGIIDVNVVKVSSIFWRLSGKGEVSKFTRTHSSSLTCAKCSYCAKLFLCES